MLDHVLFSLRIRAGLTKHDVACRADLADSYICMLEQGLRLPSRKVLPRLAQALDTSTDMLTRALQADRSVAMATCPPAPGPKP